MSPAPVARPTIIALSHLRWDFVFQRPQQLLTRAARTRCVYFVEEALREGERFDERRLQRDGVTVIQPIVPAETDDPAEIDRHIGRIVSALAQSATRPLLLWFYTPMALPWAEGISADAVVYDKMDELSAFAFAPPELIDREAELLARADVVFTGGRAMFEAAAGRHANLHCFPSSIDVAHFGGSRVAAAIDPADQRGLAHPRIGFFGVIDERLDQQLLAEVAARRRDWQFVMVGPTAKVDPARLPRADNIHWLGPKPYADLPAYLAHWDAGWMPFALNESTRFISPTKTPEFLAAGLPLVSTAIVDVVRPWGESGLVAIAVNVLTSISALETALAGPLPGWKAAVDAALATGSWDQTWRSMEALVGAITGARQPIGASYV